MDQALDRDQREAFAFLCKDILKCDVRLVKSPSDLFKLLEEEDFPSEDRLTLLSDLLLNLNDYQCFALLKELDPTRSYETGSHITPYR